MLIYSLVYFENDSLRNSARFLWATRYIYRLATMKEHKKLFEIPTELLDAARK